MVGSIVKGLLYVVFNCLYRWEFVEDLFELGEKCLLKLKKGVKKCVVVEVNIDCSICGFSC